MGVPRPADDRPAYGPRDGPGGNRHNHQPRDPVGLFGYGFGRHGIEGGEDAGHGEAHQPDGRINRSLVAYEKQHYAEHQRPGHIPAQVFHVRKAHQHPGSDQRTDDAAGIETRSGEDRIGVVDQPYREEPDPDVPGDETRHTQRTQQDGPVPQQPETIGHPRRMPAAFGFGHGGKLQPDAAQHGEPGIDRQQQTPRTRERHERRDDGRQQQQRGVAENLSHGQVARHPLARHDGRQQGVDRHLERRIADAEQPEAGEVPAQCAALACEEGHQQAGDREGIADHRHGLAADAVHQCRQGGRQDEEPKEHHRRQETHGRLLRCGKFGGDTPRDRSHDIAEPHDKEAHKHGPENTFIYFVDTHRRRFFIHTIFQSYVFFDKFPALGPHYFTIRHHCDQTATFRRTKNVQDTRHRGRGQRLPAQIFPSLAEACRWLIINLKAIRHDDPAMNKKKYFFSCPKEKYLLYLYHTLFL